MATDDFNRADGPLGSNWTRNTWWGDNGTIVSNAAKYDGTGGASIYWWNPATFADNQYAHVQYTGTSGGTDTHGPVVRHALTPTDGPCYFVQYADYLGGVLRLYKFTAAAGAVLLAGPQNVGTYVEGMILRLDCTTVSGNAYLEVFIDGVSKITHTNSASPLLSGSAGIWIHDALGATVNTWVSGDLGGGQPTSKRHGGVPFTAMPGRRNVW